MTAAFSAHWGSSFTGTPTCAVARATFCANYVTPIPPTRITRPSAKEVGQAVRKGAWSAPGPDGLSGGLWSRFAALVTLDFFDATNLLSEWGRRPA